MEIKQNYMSLEILEHLNKGKSIFPKGYLSTIGEMERCGVIEVVGLYEDGSAVIRKIITTEIKQNKFEL